MILRAAARTDVGRRRPVNEDRYALAPEMGLYLVADGMGGHKAGQVASRIATEAALRAVRMLQGDNVAPAERLRHAVRFANREILATAEAKPDLKGMGTTLVALLAAGGRAALAHVGDSRAYLIRRGQIRRLTDDHSLVGELLRRRQITEDDARMHPHRHVLTRAVGVRAGTEPDLAELTPVPGDVFAMCSDGLTNHLRDEEIAEALSVTDDLEAATDGLIETANERGGEDNTTVVLVRYEKDETPAV